MSDRLKALRLAIELAAEKTDEQFEKQADGVRAWEADTADELLGIIEDIEEELEREQTEQQLELPLWDDKVWTDARLGIAWRHVNGHKIVVDLKNADLLTKPITVELSSLSRTQRTSVKRVSISAVGGGLSALGKVVLQRSGRWVEDLTVDHLNHDPLDGRDCNLEAVTYSENMRRRRPRGSSRFLNVTRRLRKIESSSFEVSVRDRDGVYVYGGIFKDEIEAARAADRLSIKLWGPDAKTNVKLGLLPPLEEQGELDL